MGSRNTCCVKQETNKLQYKTENVNNMTSFPILWLIKPFPAAQRRVTVAVRGAGMDPHSKVGPSWEVGWWGFPSISWDRFPLYHMIGTPVDRWYYVRGR